MASLASPPQTLPPALIRAEMILRQPTLALYGLALLAAVPPLLLMMLVDPRLLDGASVWAKPVKFLISISIFSLTAAWFFGYIRPDRRGALPLRAAVWMLVAMGSFELVWIGWQASQGLASHFNQTTPFYSAMYKLMGISAVFLIGSILPLAWEIARRPAAGLRPDFVAAVVIGLVLTFVLGTGVGGYMGAQSGHSVGAEGGHVPLFGWNRSGGDLRIAHFLGIHAEQAIPMLAALVAPLAARLRWLLLGGGVTLYVAATLATFAQAVSGRALLPL